MEVLKLASFEPGEFDTDAMLREIRRSGIKFVMLMPYIVMALHSFVHIGSSC